MAEREWCHNWRSGAGADDQKHFYTYLRSQIELDADNYDFRIQGILASWRFISVSVKASSDTAFSVLGHGGGHGAKEWRLRAARFS